MAAEKNMKTECVGENMEKKGKGEKEKVEKTFRYLSQLYVLSIKHLIQIAKYFDRGGRGNGCWGTKMKTEGVGKINENEGERGKGKIAS